MQWHEPLPDPSDRPPGGALARLAARYRLGSWLFVRLLGLVFLTAFVSFWVQAHGLIGERGILPATDLLHAASRLPAPERYLRLPTVFWLGGGDGALDAACALGVAASGLVVLGLVQAPALFACWVLYLSVCTVGQVFFGYQWDVLLLEAGLLGVFLAPAAVRSPLARAEPPPALGLLLIWWLLFRLMVSSGAAKLASGDPAWRSLQALRYHFETQPLPTPIGWLAHQAPDMVLAVATLLTLAIELAVPFLIFGPRRLRRLAFEPLVALQVLIALTGNYGFFNLLTIALCVPLLDDPVWPRWLRRRLGGAAPGRAGADGETAGHQELAAGPEDEAEEGERHGREDREEEGAGDAGVDGVAGPGGGRRARRPYRVRRWLLVPFTALVVVVSAVQLAGATGVSPGWIEQWPAPVLAVARAVAPFRSINGYALFATMTTDRPELVVEGSLDGETWRPYRFRWKPGDPARRPGVVEPHMPRLDWQMWFAAIGAGRGADPRFSPWLLSFLARLAEGSPPVLDLLAEDPFPGERPVYLRVRLEDYRFTDWKSWRADGLWWRRQPRGIYVPRLRAALLSSDVSR